MGKSSKTKTMKRRSSKSNSESSPYIYLRTLPTTRAYLRDYTTVTVNGGRNIQRQRQQFVMNFDVARILIIKIPCVADNLKQRREGRRWPEEEIRRRGEDGGDKKKGRPAVAGDGRLWPRGGRRWHTVRKKRGWRRRG
ncbi:hypothetical protein KSS87_002768 [Heliosperma pusillum]|nr:hypothetical protein KSS87_002768 [Heliosperma pusillum]